MNDYLSRKITYLNFFLIVGIVFLHSYNMPADHEKAGFVYFFENFFTNGIFRSVVPMFFMLSGYLFFINLIPSYKGFGKKIIKRTRTLLIPFLLTSVLSALIVLTLNHFYKVPERFVINEVRDFLKIVFIYPVPYQLWFIRDLFILALLSPLIYLLNKHLWFIFIPVLFVIWFPNHQIFKLFDNESILFYSIGSVIALKATSCFLINKPRKFLALFLLILWVVLLTFKQINLLNNWSGLFHKISELIGCGFLWIAYDYVFSLWAISKKTGCAIEPYLKYSFFIFLTHEPVLTLIKKGLLVVSQSDIFLLAIYILSPLITIFICISVGFMMIAHLNKPYLILTGGRITTTT